MKRIAVTFGSLSLVLMQNGFAEPVNSLEPAAISERSDHGENPPSSLESLAVSALEELDVDDELLSLEQEFEEDTLGEDSMQALNEELETSHEITSSFEIPQIFSLEGDSVLSELSLESTHTPLSTPSDVVVETISTDAALENDSSFNEALTSMPIKTVDVQKSPAIFVAEADVEAGEVETPLQGASETVSGPVDTKKVEISLKQVFYGSPTIYVTLIILSILSFTLWLFNLLSLKKLANSNDSFIKTIRERLVSNQFEEVLALCKQDNSFFAKIMGSGVSSRRYGLEFMLESMKSEGKRSSVSFWQRLNIIHDIAIVAPMIGLLGTVLGMFYAFYDLNRSFESITSLFDGLGVSVGTTVAGIFVAVLSMILHSVSKYRLVKSLTFVENEAVSLAHLIDSKRHP